MNEHGPRAMVRDYCDLFEKYVSKHALERVGFCVRMPAFDEILGGFDNCYIIFELAGNIPHNKALAGCVCKRMKEREIVVAVIEVTSDFLDLSEAMQKMVIAHEWIHAMLCFNSIEQDSTYYRKRISDRNKMLLFFESLKERMPEEHRGSFWEDDPEFVAEMRDAMRRLLVTKKSLEDCFKEIRDDAFNFETLAIELKCDSNKALVGIVEPAIALFSMRHHVDSEIVWMRFKEILLKGE